MALIVSRSAAEYAVVRGERQGSLADRFYAWNPVLLRDRAHKILLPREIIDPMHQIAVKDFIVNAVQ